MSNSPPFTNLQASHPQLATVLSQNCLVQNEPAIFTQFLCNANENVLPVLIKAFDRLELEFISYINRNGNLQTELQETIQDLTTTRASLVSSQAELNRVNIHYNETANQAQNTYSTTIAELNRRQEEAQAEISRLQAALSTSRDTPNSSSTLGGIPPTTNDEALQNALAQVTQLSSENHSLRNTNSILQTTNTTLSNAFANINVANQVQNHSSANHHPTRPRGEDPTEFSGQEKDTFKRHTEYLVWKGKIKDKWLQNQAYYTIELDKILHARGLLKGSAFLSTDSGAKSLYDHPNDSSKWKWPTANAFIAWLDTKYIISSITSMATAKLQAHRMEGKFSAFPDFLTEFTNLAD